MTIPVGSFRGVLLEVTKNLWSSVRKETPFSAEQVAGSKAEDRGTNWLTGQATLQGLTHSHVYNT